MAQYHSQIPNLLILIYTENLKFILINSYDGNGNVPVRICTTWLEERTAESVDHDPFYLEDAMTTDTLLNISMKLGWMLLGDAEKAKIDKDRYWEIGKTKQNEKK